MPACITWERFTHPATKWNGEWSELGFVGGKQVAGILDKCTEHPYRAYAGLSKAVDGRFVAQPSKDFNDYSEAKSWVEQMTETA